jgi:site-specific DNA recombinase
MTRAAIYARKSTDQHVAADAKSTHRQVDNARAFATKQGWSVSDEHIFVDDGISGAEFDRRPALQQLLRATKLRQFSMLIVSEQKSLGREMSETAYLIKTLAKAGVTVVEYVHGKSLTPRGALDKLLSTVQSFSDEDHREKTSERVHEAHARLHASGRVVGGRTFGYRNRVVYVGEDAHGNPLRSHVVREVNEEEARVVRRIFELYGSGVGLRGICKTLTVEGAVAPRPFVRKDPTKVSPVRGWAPGTVRAILGRDLYRGVVVWNRSKKRDDWGSVHQRPRPQSEWKTTTVPALRIIADDLWARVASRRSDTAGKTLRFNDGRLSGRPPKHASSNLLAGLATCGTCGGSLVVETSGRKGGRVGEYVCYRRRASGTCTNDLRLPVDDLNDAVLHDIEAHALTPEAVESVIALSERDDVQERAGGTPA